MRAVRTLPVGELSVRGRAEPPPPGGGSIAAAVEAFLTVAEKNTPDRRRADEPSGTHRAIDLEASHDEEIDEEDLTASDDEARDRSVVDAVLAMLGPSPVAELLRMPPERLRGGTGGADPASADAARPPTADHALGARTLGDLGIVSEGMSIVARLPSAYPTVRPTTPRSLSDVAMNVLPGASSGRPASGSGDPAPVEPRPGESRPIEPRPIERGDAVRAALETAAHRARSAGSSAEGRRTTLPPDTVGRPKDAPKTLPAPVLSTPARAPSAATGAEAIAPNALAPNAVAPNAIAPNAVAANAVAPNEVVPNAVAPGSEPNAIAPGSVVVTEAVVTGLLRPKGAAAAEGPAPSEGRSPSGRGPRRRSSRDAGRGPRRRIDRCDRSRAALRADTGRHGASLRRTLGRRPSTDA
jgi:hypothetical protein